MTKPMRHLDKLFSNASESIERLGGQHFCTDDQPEAQRVEWLKEIIGKEYTNVDVMPPKETPLYNDMLIYPWRQGLRLSPIQSNPIRLQRLPQEPTENNQDCYFMVLLTSGRYKLEQAGREVFLQAGDMSFYDATEPHRVTIPDAFSKIIISIPRTVLDERIPNLEQLTATRIPTNNGVGAVTRGLIQSTLNQLEYLEETQFQELSDPMLDMLSLSLNQLRGDKPVPTKHRQFVLTRAKQFIENNLSNPDITASTIAQATNLSIRYLNDLFSEENNSVMRYVTQQRLEKCRRQLASQLYAHHSITDIAMRHGFNNMAHFSRSFKTRYGISPRRFRALDC